MTNLESRLGIRSVQRSTRRLTLTSEGEQFYEDVCQVLASLREAEANASAGVLAPTGRLRVGASHSFCLLHLMPVVEQFRARYPEVRVEVVSSNRYYDFENGLDLAITLKRTVRSRFVGLRRRVDYLRHRPNIYASEEFRAIPWTSAGHDLILYTLADSWNELAFTKGDEKIKIEVDGIINANDGQLICAAARRGLGILVQPVYIIQDDLQAGRLVRVLDDWDLPRLTVNIAFPTKSLLPARTRLFIDF